MLNYNHVTEEDIGRMNPAELLQQYTSLRNFLRKHNGTELQVDSSLPPDRLRSSLLADQDRFIEVIEKVALAQGLRRWGALHPGPVLSLG